MTQPFDESKVLYRVGSIKDRPGYAAWTGDEYVVVRHRLATGLRGDGPPADFALVFIRNGEEWHEVWHLHPIILLLLAEVAAKDQRIAELEGDEAAAQNRREAAIGANLPAGFVDKLTEPT